MRGPSPLAEGQRGRAVMNPDTSLAEVLGSYDASAPLDSAFTIPAPWGVYRMRLAFSSLK